MSYNCTVCGNTIVVQIYRGTPWCSQTCQKKAEPDALKNPVQVS